MMRVILKRIVVVTLLITSCSLLLFAQKPAPKSDREKEGLVGPVLRVTIETAFFKPENERLIESPRRLVKEYEYDRTGKLVFTQKKPVLGDPRLCDERFKYDEKGREKEMYCLGDPKEKVLEKYSYEEDDRYGNWLKRVASVPDITGDTFHIKYVMYREIEYFE